MFKLNTKKRRNEGKNNLRAFLSSCSIKSHNYEKEESYSAIH